MSKRPARQPVHRAPAKVDVDASPHVAGQFRIQSIPTLCLFRSGKEVARQSGAMPLGTLLQWVEQALAASPR